MVRGKTRRSRAMAVGDKKGSAVKSIWVGVSLFLLSIVAYSGFSDALSGIRQPVFEMAVSPSIVAALPSQNPPGEAIALDAASGEPAADSARNDSHLTAYLSTYVFLHKTSNESLPVPTIAGLSVPWHWLRNYTITPSPTENR